MIRKKILFWFIIILSLIVTIVILFNRQRSFESFSKEEYSEEFISERLSCYKEFMKDMKVEEIEAVECFLRERMRQQKGLQCLLTLKLEKEKRNLEYFSCLEKKFDYK